MVTHLAIRRGIDLIHKLANPYWRLALVMVVLSLLFVRLIGVIPVHAQQLPAFPNTYQGSATIQGVPVKDGAFITARMGDMVFGPSAVKDGSFYNLSIVGKNSQNKEVITFYLQGVEPAAQQKIYKYVNYPILLEEISLTFNSMPAPTPTPSATPTSTPVPTITPIPTPTSLVPPTPTPSPLLPMSVGMAIVADGPLSRGEIGWLTVEADPNGHRILRLEAIISADPRQVKILGSEPGNLLPRALSGQQVSGSAVTVIIFQLDATPALERIGSLVRVEFEVLRDGGADEVEFELLGLNVMNEHSQPVPIDLEQPEAFAILTGLPGDVNGDALVNIVDLALFGRAFGTSERGRYYESVADFNADGVVDTLDLSTIVYYYDKRS